MVLFIHKDIGTLYFIFTGPHGRYKDDKIKDFKMWKRKRGNKALRIQDRSN